MRKPEKIPFAKINLILLNKCYFVLRGGIDFTKRKQKERMKGKKKKSGKMGEKQVKTREAKEMAVRFFKF